MILRALKRLAAFWWNFLIGDDWTIGFTVVAALAATYAIKDASVHAWWLVPLAGLGVVTLSLSRR